MITILASYALSSIEDKNKRFIITGFVCLILFIFQYPMWTNYTKIMFPETDRGQYIVGSTVGVGVKEIIDFARTKSQEQKVVIIAEGNFGLVGDLLDTYLRPTDKNIEIRGYWPLTASDLTSNQKELEHAYVYVVTGHQMEIPADWPVRKIQSYYKEGKQSAIHLLELTD